MKCRLILRHGNKTDDVVLYHEPKLMVQNRNSQVSLFSEDRYKCSVVLSEVERQISYLELFLNEELIGYCFSPKQEQKNDIVFYDDTEDEGGSPIFNLYYDLIKLSLKVQFTDQSYIFFSSNYLLCFNRDAVTAENVEALIKYLVEFNDDTINRWMYAPRSRSGNTNLFLESGLQKNSSYKSLHSYIQLLTSIYISYKENYPIFKSNIRHRIVKDNTLQTYDKIRNINTTSMQWLFQNIGQLVEVSTNTTVQLNGRNYIPFQMNVEKAMKNFDIYENRVVSGFLLLVSKHARQIEEQLIRWITDETKIVDNLRQMEREGFHAPIIAVKQMQLANTQQLLNTLQELIVNISVQYSKYQEISIYSDRPMTGIPKKTKIFQEVRSYRLIFEQIMKWYKFGEFTLVKESLIFNVKTLDKLYEYYCLCKLLTMFKNSGFNGADDQFPSLSYEYNPDGYPYLNEYDIANTYFLKRKDVQITLYYQPVIRSDDFENGITLFRTTLSNNNYYSPDFLFKVWSGDSPAWYFIMDAKYSTRNAIKRHYLDRVMIKYSCELSSKEPQRQPIRMVWLLQGRIDNTSDIELFHNAPLVKQYKPDISYGIISINTKNNALEKLWHEMYACIRELEKRP
ncbi:MAG: DUF2357 domain-containing protein [Treponema sp.]|jgi:hypothetical protein|nr:DUF2357 domain-containing protein [Treponema sp.]